MSYEKFFRDVQKNRPSDRKTVRAAASKVNRQGTAQSNLSPEDLVKAHFASMKNLKSQRRLERTNSRRSRPPIFAMLMLAVAVGAGAIGYLRPELADRLTQIPGVEIGLFGEASAEPKGNPTDPKPESTQGEKKSAAAAENAPDHSEGDKNPDIRQWTPEEVSFFKKLSERKETLDRREAELNKLEEELQKQKKGLEDRIHQLESMRKEISATLKERVGQDQEKIAKLVDVYSNMKPVQAARVIEALNEELAVTILDKMKKKNAAEVLNSMAAPKAKKLSEMLTGYETAANESGKK